MGARGGNGNGTGSGTRSGAGSSAQNGCRNESTVDRIISIEHIKCEPQVKCQNYYYYFLKVGGQIFGNLGLEKLERMTRSESLNGWPEAVKLGDLYNPEVIELRLG